MVSLVDWVGLNYVDQYKVSKKCWISILRYCDPNLIHRASPDQEVSIKAPCTMLLPWKTAVFPREIQVLNIFHEPSACTTEQNDQLARWKGD